MRRTLINQIVRGALAIPMFLVAFSFVSCSDDDDDDDDDITLTADTSADDTSDDEETTSSETSDDETTSSGTTYINGYAAVDLGLSVKWATCNIGADSPEDYGNYYAWGETETKDEYKASNSATYGVEMDDIAGNADYDAATANWGSSWRMPTYDEMKELVDSCTWTWTTENDINGCLVTGPNANSIFLPAAGYRGGTSLYSAGFSCDYWSSTPYGSDPGWAYDLFFNSSTHFVDRSSRYYGYTVRPVSE